MVSLSKTKYLIKKYLALTYKKHYEININKMSEESKVNREQFIRLFMQHGQPHNFKNVICFDETAWYA